MAEEIHRRGKQLTSRFPKEYVSKTKVTPKAAPSVQETVRKIK